MKILTVQQPWATLIIQGIKQVENRTWATSYRGPVLIHAGKSRRSCSLQLARAEMPDTDGLPFGAILGIVELIDCVPLAEAPASRFASGPWCWVLAESAPLRQPLPWTGTLGLRDASPDLLRQINELQRPGKTHRARRQNLLFGDDDART